MNDKLNLKYLGYTRKSSEDNKERQAASLPDQMYVIEGIKAKQNLNVIDILQEAKSAHQPGREIFNTMLKRIEGGEANAIVTWHPNRLARNMIDGGRIIFLMDEEKLIEIRTPSRIFHNTPDDKFLLNLEFSISKKDSDDKSIVVKRGLERKCREHWRPGVAPQGYLNDKNTESGLRKIYTDKEKLPFITKIFHLFNDGTPAKEILRIANEEWRYTTPQKKRMGGKPLTLSGIYEILTNPFYCGKFEYRKGSGNWYEGEHDKAISEELFNEVQLKLGHRSPYKLKHHEFAFNSLMRCGVCASGVVMEEKWQIICPVCKIKFAQNIKVKRSDCPKCKTLISNMVNPKILHYIYCRCGRKKGICGEKSIRVDNLEKQIDKKLSQIELSPLFMDWAIRQIQKMSIDERNFREDTIQAIKRAYDECRMKLDNLLRLKISPANSDGSLLSDEKYKEEKVKLESELKNIEKQLNGIDNRMLQANEDSVKAFNFATRARIRFANGDAKTKRDIFMGLGLNLTLQNRTVDFDSPKYILTLKRMKEEAPIIAERVEPEKELELKPKMEEMFASIPSLCRHLEEIRTYFLTSPTPAFIPDLR
jgi:Zn finger protein HypA/HybF involved in hydrogenase expression